ncbi:hypothetical protein CU254_42520 (plasmid) [Amycolatopsis sp. AA4]|uniref:hypothetical protein n=1 Tax=Actinomycetes TaxID=1760 RepID=UPI0001B57163|nr:MULTISPECIES: hypothetical protein [Actinomycetes]ATY17262.1 hypothetical protein CU254_42520 [Amycolatopsis sp. AA4]
MFERGDEGPDARQALRRVGMPRPVWVRMSTIVPAPVGWGRSAPPWMRAGGVDAGAIVRGEQLSWVATSTGCWMAVVRMSVPSQNQRLRVDLAGHLLSPEEFIPAEPGQKTMTHAEFDKTLQRRALARLRSR